MFVNCDSKVKNDAKDAVDKALDDKGVKARITDMINYLKDVWTIKFQPRLNGRNARMVIGQFMMLATSLLLYGLAALIAHFFTGTFATFIVLGLVVASLYMLIMQAFALATALMHWIYKNMMAAAAQ